ncbi:hypothetical protein AVEN_24910-1 [Araneus ventricosus]|uniref:Uncharacterized protein n=1 Tax=Araneus ventricosus TaxID=182803 RepID=A0A4Y2VPB9_ARAVE|nr:hypothetical protein AVEN_24910-1 [Araneus ventricosus]
MLVVNESYLNDAANSSFSVKVLFIGCEIPGFKFDNRFYQRTAVYEDLVHVKPRSYGLSFHEFRPRFALFPIVGTERIDVALPLVSASAVSRIMAVNSSHVKGDRSGQMASANPLTRALTRDLASHAPLERRDWSEFHQSQIASTNPARLEV